MGWRGGYDLARCGGPRGGGRQAALNRGAVYDVEFAFGRHPVVVVTRSGAIPVLSQVVVALITSVVRDIPTEVPVGVEQGLERACVVSCDNLFTIPKASLGRRRGELGVEQSRQLHDALRIALELD